MIEAIAGSLDILLFVAMFAAILLGFPVFLSLTGVAVLFALLGHGLGVMPLSQLAAAAQRIFSTMTNDTLIAIPLFVVMGVILQQSRIAEDLLEQMGQLFGRLRGGLGVSVSVVGALMAASTGIVGATVVAMAMIALPTMLRNNYDKRLSAGIVTAAGTLGQIIPPSTMLIILADVMASGYQQAQQAQGQFTIGTLSVGEIFAAALLPGLVLVALYILYVLVVAAVSPERAPAMAEPGDKPPLSRILPILLPPLLLIVLVLGSILAGIATPAESASVGAVGALMLAGRRLAPGKSMAPFLAAGLAAAALLLLAQVSDLRLGRDPGLTEHGPIIAAAALTAVLVWGFVVALLRAWQSGVLTSILERSFTITAMIFATIIGATIFALVFHTLGGQERVTAILEAMPGDLIPALLFVMAVIFVMGFFLDFVEITVIVLPIVVPVLIIKDAPPLWLAVLIAMNLQTSFMTPPFGFSLFYLRGAAPPEITTGLIYRGVVPFIVIQIVGMAIVFFFPEIATWLPRQLFG